MEAAGMAGRNLGRQRTGARGGGLRPQALAQGLMLLDLTRLPKPTQKEQFG